MIGHDHGSRSSLERGLDGLRREADLLLALFDGQAQARQRATQIVIVDLHAHSAEDTLGLPMDALDALAVQDRELRFHRVPSAARMASSTSSGSMRQQTNNTRARSLASTRVWR